MSRPFRKDPVILGLVVLAAIQIAWFTISRSGAGGERLAWLQVGDEVGAIRSFDTTGAERPLVTGERTVLLAFASDCPHCRDVASAWADWTEGEGGGLRTLAVTSEPIDQALAFVREHGLDVEIRLTEPPGRDGRGGMLTRRTPWVFVIDSKGSILAEGHGANIVSLTAGLEPRSSETTEP